MSALKLKASCIVSEVLWNLIPKNLIRKTYTIAISGGHTPAMHRMSLCNIKRQEFATGIFKTKFVL